MTMNIDPFENDKEDDKYIVDTKHPVKRYKIKEGDQVILRMISKSDRNHFEHKSDYINKKYTLLKIVERYPGGWFKCYLKNASYSILFFKVKLGKIK